MTPMGKRRPGIGILPLLMIVFLCISWLTALNRQDEMTYDQMVQLFEQQKVESFQFTDSSVLYRKWGLICISSALSWASFFQSSFT